MQYSRFKLRTIIRPIDDGVYTIYTYIGFKIINEISSINNNIYILYRDGKNQFENLNYFIKHFKANNLIVIGSSRTVIECFVDFYFTNNEQLKIY